LFDKDLAQGATWKIALFSDKSAGSSNYGRPWLSAGR